MTFLENIQRASQIPETLHWVLGGYLIVALTLYITVPSARSRVRSTLVIFGLSIAGIVAAAAMLSLGAKPDGTPYRTVICVSMFVGGVAMANLAGVVVFAVILRSVRLEPPHIAQDLLLALAYFVVAMLVLSHGGVGLSGIVATSAVVTAVIGFSLQDSLGNVMGGLVLQMERTIKVGDWIRVDDTEGKVKQIRWRQTSIETRNWDTVIIPNGTLMKTKVVALGRRAGAPLQRRQWVYFRVDLGQSPTKVIHAIESALHGDTIRHVAHEPKPQCIVTDFKDGDAIYAVRYWLTDLSQADPTDSLVRTRIYGALRRAGMTLSIPTQSVMISQETEAARERRQSEEAQRRIETLGGQELLQSLTDEERGELAHRLVTAHFVRGEAITRQGAEAHWLYIIAEGDADVEVGVDGKTQKVATLHAGDLFGEMGLMTGEPRTATVNALTDVICYRLGKAEFQGILRSRPELVEQISMTLARRRVELEAVREQLSQDARNERMRSMQGALLRGIRDFFGINSTKSLS